MSHIGQLPRPPRRSRRIGGRAVGGSPRTRRDVTSFKRWAAWDARISRTPHATPCALLELRRLSYRQEREGEREREASALLAYSSSLPSSFALLRLVLLLSFLASASRFLFPAPSHVHRRSRRPASVAAIRPDARSPLRSRGIILRTTRAGARSGADRSHGPREDLLAQWCLRLSRREIGKIREG